MKRYFFQLGILSFIIFIIVLLSGCTTISNDIAVSDINFAPGISTGTPWGGQTHEYFYDSSIYFTVTNTGSVTNRDYPSYRGRMYDNNGKFVLNTETDSVGILEPGQSKKVTLYFNNAGGTTNFKDFSGRMEIIETINNVDGRVITYTFNNALVNTQTSKPIRPTYTSSLSTPKNAGTSNVLSNSEWIWSRDHWDGWQHTVSWSGREAGLNSEFGPAMIGDHGEYGTDTQLYGGSTESSVWRTFTDQSGVGWNTIEFIGMLSGTDTPSQRWMTIDVNDQQVFKDFAVQNPPGNGVKFVIKRTFRQSPSVKVKISNGQDSAFGGRFSMDYYSVKLSLEN